jgi:rSAM/selenodomain-associated transferase 1
VSGVGREPVVIVFGRVPRLGEVKTRLARSVGDAEALRVHRALLGRTLQQAASLAGARVQLAIAGEDTEGEGAALAAVAGAELVRQRGGDLGARMDNALRAALARSLLPVLVGCDCPVLCADDLREAFGQLAGVDAVFAPAEDGGYALVGASREITPAFSGVPWGTAAVMAATRERLLAARFSWRELRTLWDVDDEAGYRRWRQG